MSERDKTDVRIARVAVDEKGDWILTVSGTGIRRVLWNDRDLDYGIFPGNSMGHRLIEEGWFPDRRAMYDVPEDSTVAQRAAQARAGWCEDGERSWTLPCYPASVVTG